MPNPIPDILHKEYIRSITKIAPKRPVFKLTWNENPQTHQDRYFILKAEFRSRWSPDAEETLKFAYGLMREAARGVRGRPLDATETRWLYELVDTGKLDTGANAEVKNLLQGKAQFKWIIMGFKAGLMDLEAVVDEKDAAKAALILSNLRDGENLERLGAILVVDMFLNNSDRFKVLPGKKGIQNQGNVFFVDKGNGILKIKGLDPFDPSRSNAVLDQMLNNPRDLRDLEEWWSGTLLTDDKELKRVAQNACESLNEELLPILRKAGYEEKVIEKDFKLGKSHVSKVITSMEKTRKKVKDYCEARRSGMSGKAKPVAGLESRMKELGWIK
ncbi:MAG: hypothetical protein AB1898_10435 [Acidobacteriota bacterium]